MNIDQLKNQFYNPPAKFTFAPFWFLNHELTDEELKWQINEMNANGVKGFIMHARHGLITEYMSEEWMDRIETCIKEADKLGMKAYLYDENNWPSGPVDGVLLEKYPQYRMSGCIVTGRFQVSGGKKLKQKLDLRDGLLAAVAVPVEKGVLAGLPESGVLLDAFVENDTLEWEAPEDTAKWAVFIFARTILRGGTFFGGYLDTLNKDAVGKFIEMTHVPYTERFGKYYGGTVDGIFTDEPSMNYFGTDTVPFTPTLPSEFGWRHGYDLYRVLPAVFEDAGPATAQLRCDFQDTITHLYQQAFFKQIYEYCDEHRLNLIGHVMQEGELYESTHHQGDYFRGAEYMHFAGCDFLCELTWPRPGVPFTLNNLVGPKLASSAAHLFDKPRVMSECFGLAGGWGIDLRTLKWMTDWLVTMGVNFLQPHAFYYSIQGHRKWECPPGEFYQSPFWSYYKYYADYSARLCSLFTDAQHVADVAVIWPSRSMWTTVDPSNTDESKRVVTSFEMITTALVKAGYDFDIVPEEVLNAEFSSDLLHLGSGEKYKALIVPHVTTLLTDTADFIGECIGMGSNVILAGEGPATLVTDSDALWDEQDWSPELFNDLFGSEFDPETGQRSKRAVVEEYESSVKIKGAENLDENQLASAFSSLFTGMLDADVTIINKEDGALYVPDVVFCHYRHGDDDFYMLVNTNRERGYSTRISLDTIGIPSIWNAETGDVTAISSYEMDGDRMIVDLDFLPCESYVLSVTTSAITDEITELVREPQYSKVIEMSDEWEFCTDKPNALPLAQWQFSMASYGKGDWGSASHVYTTEFDCDTELSVARLAIDGLLTEKIWRGTQPVHVDITLNGERVDGFEEGDYIDHLIFEANVLPFVKRGKNVLQIRCSTQLAPAGNLSDPVYLIGDFEVRGQAGSFKLVPSAPTVKAGDWTNQGYPFYSGIATYRQVVTLPKTTKRVLLRMEKPGDVAEVMVNGEFAAVLPWEPWAADITDLVKSGENEIVIKVANSMTNVFLMEPKPSGILGKVEIAITK